jgi:hypothetical protein
MTQWGYRPHLKLLELLRELSRPRWNVSRGSRLAPLARRKLRSRRPGLW